jgi:hypothetical protein
MERLAYAARYGHQSIEVLLHVESAWLNRFVTALSEIVRRESRAGNSDAT